LKYIIKKYMSSGEYAQYLKLVLHAQMGTSMQILTVSCFNTQYSYPNIDSANAKDGVYTVLGLYGWI